MMAREKLARLVEVLRDNLADLRRYASGPAMADIQRSRDAQHMVLHAMYVATQAAIDAATHVVADRGLPRATTYAETFDRLAEAGVIETGLARRLADWASMRNVLAHFYPVIDFGRVERALHDDLGDFDRFVAVLDRLMAADE
jgi:uncharacterized protein YutE (UPF0331/DUF86 family)